MIADFQSCRIYSPGSVVRHDGRTWILVYYRDVTCVDAPGEEEYSDMWVPLDAHKWRESPIPKFRRRGWRRRTMQKLIRQAETNIACRRAMTYIEGPNGWRPYMPKSMLSRYDLEAEKKLRIKLGLTAKDLAEILHLRQKRSARRLISYMNPTSSA